MRSVACVNAFKHCFITHLNMQDNYRQTSFYRKILFLNLKLDFRKLKQQISHFI